MKEFAVVGRPNSGKTLFSLNFAGYLNCKSVDILFRSYDGTLNCHHYLIGEAKRELCGPERHKTRHVQSMTLQVPIGKALAKFQLTDTCGLTEKIHDEEAVRKGMAQTLSLLRATDYILHIVDASIASPSHLQQEIQIDMEIYHFGSARRRYILLANKIDLPAARSNLTAIQALFEQATVLPVSALTNQGFQEVKAYVANNV